MDFDLFFVFVDGTASHCDISFLCLSSVEPAAVCPTAIEATDVIAQMFDVVLLIFRRHAPVGHTRLLKLRCHLVQCVAKVFAR